MTADAEPRRAGSRRVPVIAGQVLIVLAFLIASARAVKRYVFATPRRPTPAVASRSTGTPIDLAALIHRGQSRAATNPAATTVDLLAGLDLATATVAGHWHWQDGAAVSDTGAATRFDFGYRPPDEYDLRFEFARLTGNDGIDAVLSHRGRPFCWTMAGWNNTVSGFFEIFGKAADANPTTARGHGFENGERHVCLIKVRNDGVRAYLDDQLRGQWATDYDDLGMTARRLHRDDTIGLSTWESSYAIYAATLTEIAGAGHKLTPADPLDVKPIGVWSYTVVPRAPVDHLMYSNGHMKTPDGDELWFLRGNQILFRWGPFLDAGTLAPDGRSFDGTNAAGEVIHGDFTPAE